MDAAWIKKELEAVDFTTSQANALALVLSHLATKDDLENVRQELAGFRQHNDGELGGLRQHMDRELGGLRQHVDAGFKEVYQEFGKVRQEMGQMHQEIGQIWWKVAILMTLQAGLIVSLIKLI
jgi:hypothetical protein